MGDAHNEGIHSDGEIPRHEVVLDAFAIDKTAVSNAQFKCFVDDTGYQSIAERFGNSAVFHLDFEGEDSDVVGYMGSRWWLCVKAASWHRPFGEKSHIADRMDHPVVHIAFEDACAYCQWAGRCLPTEAQWECAARGGLTGARYPWGNEIRPDGEHSANIFQGEFPVHNDRKDGFANTVPVQTYRPNGYGLWQTVGNVWEWCADWFSPRAYSQRRSGVVNPKGPDHGHSRVMRGGSFLCHDSYCNRYRVSARSSSAEDSSTSNLGFRTVALDPASKPG